MKCTVPEISWHNRDPILSIDIQQNPKDNLTRLASGGTDCHVLIWQVKINNIGKINLEPISDLTRHQRPINIVRWSPSGQYLASGDDDSNIIIWHLKTDNIPSLDGETNDKETWISYKVLRGHKEDVYDISWSPDSNKLVSGSIDNTAIIWDLNKGKHEHIFTEHKGFVQGVSWDPKSQFVATLSSDRFCRILDCSKKLVRAKIYKGHLPVSESHELHNKEVKYFYDDTFKSFFRRLAFSPDGNLLLTPSGCIETEDCKRYLHAAYIFTMDSLLQPAAILPSPKQDTIAVRFCPILFELRPDGPEPYIELPYRMIFAIATDTNVILYDTQQKAPLAVVQKTHYTRLTDVTWSADGTILIASSTDGFCTLVTFEPDELGIRYVLEESEPEEEPSKVVEKVDDSVKKEVKDQEKTVKEPENVSPNILQVKRKEPPKDAKPRKPTILEQWAIKKPRNSKEKNSSGLKTKLANSASNENERMEIIEIKDDDDVNIKQTTEETKQVNNKQLNKLTPKRITPIQIKDSILEKCATKKLQKNNEEETTATVTKQPTEIIEIKDDSEENDLVEMTKNKQVQEIKKDGKAVKKAGNSMLEKWTIKKPRKGEAVCPTNSKEEATESIEIIEIEDSSTEPKMQTTKKEQAQEISVVGKSLKKRIAPVKIGDSSTLELWGVKGKLRKQEEASLINPKKIETKTTAVCAVRETIEIIEVKDDNCDDEKNETQTEPEAKTCEKQISKPTLKRIKPIRIGDYSSEKLAVKRQRKDAEGNLTSSKEEASMTNTANKDTEMNSKEEQLKTMDFRNSTEGKLMINMVSSPNKETEVNPASLNKQESKISIDSSPSKGLMQGESVTGSGSSINEEVSDEKKSDKEDGTKEMEENEKLKAEQLHEINRHKVKRITPVRIGDSSLSSLKVRPKSPEKSLT